MSRKYLLTAFGYAIIGLCLGIYMAASKDHSQLTAHAHMMMLGFIVSFIYAVCHKIWLDDISSRIATIQYFCHQIGTILMATGLFLLYGNLASETVLGLMLGIAALLVLTGVIMMKIFLIKATRKT